MGIFEEMGFYGNLDFLSASQCEGERPHETEQEAPGEEDYSDEEMDVDELERRMWRDRMLLRRLKDQNKGKEVDNAKQRQSQEQARRKKMSRAQDGILKYMLKMMEVCKAQGFVYGIIPENGKPVSGASDNLRAWWKEKVRDYDVDGVEDDQTVELEECKPQPRDVNNLYSMGLMGPADRLMVPQLAQVKGELIDVPSPDNFVQKRKQPSDEQQPAMMEQKIFTCEFPQCPYSDIRVGFQDRFSRNNHQMSCPYRSTPNPNHNPSRGGTLNFQMNNHIQKEPVFTIPAFAQPKITTAPPVNQDSAPSYGGLNSQLGLPGDGQRAISDLMSFYDTKHQQTNRSLNSGNLDVIGDHQNQKQKFPIQLDDFFGHGVETNIPSNQSTFLPPGFQFDNKTPYNSGFDANNLNTNENNLDFRFVSQSPFTLGGVDFSGDPNPNADINMWYL
ncbi:hypothetical protein Ccrd_013151 [Cynara cardunculus var. scolymus]|uniref:Ethylene insensitive 3-like DNA-binding domain-containing protein n=1 Tax=Cynara cardunculus var. scolymus TaxID=59895 RepID=A0A124SH54_CYNCS|nr:hypothetical protein Ccrd_013151 [Cynara cardunculus var. scolymus]